MKKFILFISLTILLASCQASPTPQLTATIKQTKIPVLPTVTPQEFLDEAQAQIAAQNALKRSFTYIEPLTVIRLEKMSYGEYATQINQPPNQPKDLEFLSQPEDLKVWFVLYYNKDWKNKPPVSNPSFCGCVYVVVNAKNGRPVEVGGPLGIGIVNECDK